MKIFDTHSDTPFDLFRDKLDLCNDVTHISLGKAEKYEKKFFVSEIVIRLIKSKIGRRFYVYRTRK